MNRNWMRVASWMICVCMLFALMTGGVSAELSGITGVVPTDEYTFFDFEEFKELCQDAEATEKIMICIYTGLADFVIEEAMTIPENMTLKTDGAGIRIPEGVNVTLNGNMQVSDLRIEGKLCNLGRLELVCGEEAAMTVVDSSCYEDRSGEKSGAIFVDCSGTSVPEGCIAGMDLVMFSAEKVSEGDDSYWKLTISQNSTPEEDPKPEEDPEPEKPSGSQKVEVTPMYRLYNPNSGEHFYTGSTQERDMLEAAGWHYEGIAWNAPTKSGAPVYRLYNPNSGDHHYTMSAKERDMLVDVGWKYEGVAWNSASSSHVPQYRLYNPNADCGSHHYTGSKEERDNLVNVGWIYEGIGWYGIA